MIKLRIRTVKSRSYQCDIAGCRNRTKYLITKRDDIASHPVHLCASCIDGIKALYDELIAAEVKETAPVTEPESAMEPAEDAEGGEGMDAGAVEETPAESAEEAEDVPGPVIAEDTETAVVVPEKKPAARRRSPKESSSATASAQRRKG